MGKVVAFMNQKGGVGKTASCVHLGAFLSSKEYKTLIIDLDPQCDSSRSLGAENESFTSFELLNNNLSSLSFFQHTNENLFVCVGNRNIKELSYKKDMLVAPITLLREHFDFILIDCNPHLIEFNRITLNEVILTASDFVIIPTESDPNSLNDSNLFVPDILKIKEKNNPNLVVLGFLFSRVENNTIIFKQAFENIKKSSSNLVFNSYIRKDEKLRQSQLDAKTIFEFDSYSNSAVDFTSFGFEFLQKINK